MLVLKFPQRSSIEEIMSITTIPWEILVALQVSLEQADVSLG